MADQIASSVDAVAPGADPAEPSAGSGLDMGFPVQGLSFQSRIAVVALVTAVVVLMGACVLFMLQQWRTERAHFIQSQQTLAHIAAAQISGDLVRGDRAGGPAALQALRDDRRLVSARLAGPDGAPLPGFAPVTMRPAAGVGEVLSIQAPIDLGSGAKGELVLQVRPD
ncbi:MAG TPA: hypothetical protein VHX64_04025, partial [Caulobacteraceae bacterium]|nr:hypothetical protein [Caulobacteraceae bacterium]